MTLPQLKNSLKLACFLTLAFICSPLSILADSKPTPSQAIYYASENTVTGPVSPCEILLQPSDVTSRPEVLAALTASLEQHRAQFTVQNPNHQLDPILNAFFLQYSKDILATSRDQLAAVITDAISKWATAQREEIELRYKAYTAIQGRRVDYKYVDNLPNAPELFPAIARLLNSPDLLEQLPGGNASTIRQSGANPKKAKPTIYEAIQSIRSGTSRMSGGHSKDLEIWLTSELIKLDSAPFRERLKTLGSNVSTTIEDRIVQTASEGSQTPGLIESWSRVLNLDAATLSSDWFKGAPAILDDLYNFLNTQYPVSNTNSKQPELISLGYQISALGQAHIRDMIAHLINTDSNGNLSLVLKSLSASIQFNPQLGAGQLQHINGAFPNPTGLDIELIHGAGTTKSSVASLRTLIGLFASYGFNPNGNDAPDAGTGVRLNGNFLQTSRYLQDSLKMTAERQSAERGRNENRLPLLALGRSMGAQKVVADRLLYEDSAADMAFAMSFSNPMTIAAQTRNVFAQLERGTISGVIGQALKDADTYSEEFLALLEQAKLASPEAFAAVGNLIVYLQGNDDEDARVVEEGQPDVFTALHQFRDQYTPAAHIYEFTNPLQGNEALTHEDPEHLEATHFLISNRDDLKRSDVAGSAAWANISDDDLPKVKSQTLEVFAVMYGSLDYMIKGLPNGAPWPFANERRAQRAMQRLRAELCGTSADGSPRTFFEWYLDRINSNNAKRNLPPITMEQIRSGAVTDRSITGRLTRVWHYWNVTEPARVEALYRSQELIP